MDGQTDGKIDRDDKMEKWIHMDGWVYGQTEMERCDWIEIKRWMDRCRNGWVWIKLESDRLTGRYTDEWIEGFSPTLFHVHAPMSLL